jgi:integrase
MRRRRANNEGSVYQRASDGRWSASVSLENGQRKHFLGKSAAEVRVKMIAFQKSQMDGLPVVNERQTVTHFLDHWLDTIKPPVRKRRTHRRYAELIRLHVLPVIGSIRLAKLTPKELQSVYSRARGAGLSTTTVHQIHAIMHRALKQACAWGDVVRNVADLVEVPPIDRKEMKVLTPEQARRFLEAAKGTRFEALWVLAVTSGMRQGELLGLRWEDLDLEHGVATVRSTLQRIDGEWQFNEPKSQKSRRQVALTPSAIDALRRHRARQNEERLHMGGTWEDWRLVFSNEIGKPMEVTNLTNRYFRPLLEKAGLDPMRFHDLRHTAATLMLAGNTPIKVASEMLGHSQTAFTMDRYMHVTLEMQMAAVAGVEGMISRSS